ncbi:MAG: Txe/YoeB family addiction module toxin [Bacteroidota bacterium]
MKYTLTFSKTALKDLEKHKKSGDQAALRKIQKLLGELIEHPTTGTGQPKILKGELSGMYARRINQKHRLVYSIQKNIITVHVLAAWSHYGDK